MNRVDINSKEWDILNEVPLGVFVLQKDYRVIFWNNCLENWSGIHRKSIIGLNIGQRYPHLIKPKYYSRLKDIFAGGPPSVFSSQLHQQIIPAKFWDGRPRIQHTIVTSIPASNGDGFHALFSIQDVTDMANRIQDYRAMHSQALTELKMRKHIEAELKKAKKKAEVASHTKSNFLANMSHEIRTPMNTILGMSELLSETSLDSGQQKYVNAFRKAGYTLLSLINAILDLSKVESGLIQLEERSFDLEELADNLMDLVALGAHTKGLEIACHINSDVPTKLSGDPNRLQQILLNLVSNAIKFTKTGEVIVHVDVIEKEENITVLKPVKNHLINQAFDDEHKRVKLLFSVKDTGVGIPSEKLGAVFESFIQADSSISRNYGGTGLGLTISKQLAQLMGGTISVESKVGHGSAFNFTARFRVQHQAKQKNPKTSC